MTAVHATAIVVGEAGVLIRGASGAGKSLLALTLVSRARRDRSFAALVGDDRVWLEPFGDRLVARGKAEMAGVCERRWQGLVETPHEPQAVLRLLVDLGERGEAAPPRMPGAADLYGTLCGVRLPRVRLDLAPGLEEGASAVIAALTRIENNFWRRNVLHDEVFA